MPEVEWISDLDAEGACAAVERLHAERVRAEFELFALAAHWADLHCGAALDQERARRGIRVRPGMERSKRAGAHGTPRVAEFAAAELAALQGMGHVAGDHLVRDAVNVRDRHPLLWAALAAGVGRVWQGRKVAQLCAAAQLSWEQAGWVDAQTTEYLGALPWGRFEALVVAKIAEADPAAAAQRARAAALRRFVATGQSSEHGLKTLVARASAGEVIYFVAMVDRIAQVLALHGDPDPVDVRRSKAIGILANPARALALLHSATQTAGPADPSGGAGDTGDTSGDNGVDDAGAGDGSEAGAGGGDSPGASADGTDSGASRRASGGDDGVDDAGADGDDAGDSADDDPGGEHANAEDPDDTGAEDPEVITEADVHPSQNDADDPAPQPRPCPTCAGAGQVTGDPAAFTRPLPVDPRRLLPDATLYIHLPASMLTGQGPGIATMEGVGPLVRDQVIEFLGHANVRPVAVIDPADIDPVDGYVVPDKMAEALHLRNPACVSPWATHTGRRKDHDHVIPYLPRDKGGPPGQTGMHNIARLARFPHRLKTHGRWRLRQPRPGVYEWTSPHGYRYLVDDTGTHPQGKTPRQDE